MAFRSISPGYLLFCILHFGQFVLAVTVCGLYGVELSRAAQAGKNADGRWVGNSVALSCDPCYGVLICRCQVFAEVVGGLSAVTSLLYFIPFILRFALVWAWNLILFILWIALFGVFGSVSGHRRSYLQARTNDAGQMYIKEDPEGNGDIQRMKNAVWVVLANAILWLIATLGYFTYWWGHREHRSRFTSRAKV